MIALDVVLERTRVNNEVPTSELDKLVICPDGRLRGLRPPSILYHEAVTAANAGRHDDALKWLLISIGHDESAKKMIRDDITRAVERLLGNRFQSDQS